MQILNAYVDGSSVAVLERKPDGKLSRTLVPAEYAMFLRRADVPEELARSMARSSFVKAFKIEGDWIRINWADQFIRESMCFGKRGGPPSPIVEAGIQTYEGDVHPIRRLFTDKGATVQRPRRSYIDLETDSRVPFSRKEEARILSWAVIDDGFKLASGVLPEDTNIAERDLLYELFAALEEYDQILAWNGDGFDFPVINARLDLRGCRIDTRRYLWLDHLEAYKKINVASESGDEKSSMKLESVAQSQLGHGKHDFDASKTYEAWAAGGASRQRLHDYMVQDTRLLPEIEAKTGFIDVFQATCEACRVLPETRSLQSTVQMDGYMLRLGIERNVHFVTKRFRENAEEKFKGAFVMEPNTKGIMRDVHVADFAALYPSIILTWNMSPETKRSVPINGPIPEGMNRCPLTGQGFDNTVEGILPIALRDLIRMRKYWNDLKASLTPGTPEWKEADRKSTAYKTVANSFYGVVGSPFSRFFDRAIAESVTQNGVWLIRATIQEADRRLMKTVYGDTDSLFVMGATRTAFEEFVKDCNTDLYPALLKTVGCTRNEIKLAYEKQFERIVIVTAKRYCGRFAHYKGKAASADSKPEIKGLEYKRGDAALLARRLQEECILMLMGGEERKDVFKNVLTRTIDHVMNDVLPNNEVILSKGLSKPLKEYVVKTKNDGTPAATLPHVQVAKLMAARGLEVGEGTRIEYFVADGDPSSNLVVRPADEYTGVEADRYYLWENLIYPPTQRLLQSAFPDFDWSAGLEKLRPAKARKGRKAVNESQLGMLINLPSKDCVKVDVPERMGEGYLPMLKDVFDRHRGARPVELHLLLESGHTVLMSLPHRVTGSPQMLSELEVARHLFEQALNAWEVTCVG